MQAVREGRRLRDATGPAVSQTIPTPVRIRVCDTCTLLTVGIRLGRWSSFTPIQCDRCRSKQCKGNVVQLEVSTTEPKSRNQAIRGWKRGRVA